MRKLLLMFFILHVLGTFLAVDSTIGAPIPMPPSVLAVDGVINPTEPPPTPPLPTNPPSTSGGNFSHIDIWDMGGNYLTASSGSNLLSWYASHVDATQETPFRAPGSSSFLKQYNPNMIVTVYQLDHTQFINTNCEQPWSACFPSPNAYGITAGAAPDESYYLHFSENTTIQGVSIPGCPSPNPVTSSCRVRVYMWADWRYVFNPKSLGWRQWAGDRIIGFLGTRFDGFEFDEHLPGFRRGLYNPSITQGGGIREYGGLHMYDPETNGANQLDREYNTDLSNWLTYLRGRCEAAGKNYTYINPASDTVWPPGLAAQQAGAIKGIYNENSHQPDVWSDSNHYQDQLNVITNLATIQGSTVILGSKNYFVLSYEPSGYTSGNYDSPQSRYVMWRLANYYIHRAMPGSPGKVYFDAEFSTQHGSAVPNQWWRDAIAYNIGSPTGSASVYYTGSAGCSGTYKIWTRDYTNGKVFLRIGDPGACGGNWDAAYTLTVSPAMRRLNADGTFSAYTTTFTLRNAEALILSK